jgi:hypothetical protein
MSWNLGASSCWNPQGLSRPVMGFLYLLATLLDTRCNGTNVLVHTTKTHGRKGGTAPCIILRTIWRTAVSSTPCPLHLQGKSPLYALNRRLGGSKRRFEHLRKHKRLLSLPKIVRFLGRPARSMKICSEESLQTNETRQSIIGASAQSVLTWRALISIFVIVYRYDFIFAFNI